MLQTTRNIIVMSVCYALCLLAFGLRVFVRLRYKKRTLSNSDYWTSIAFVMVTVATFIDLARVIKERELGQGNADNLLSINDILARGGPEVLSILNAITDLLRLAFVGVNFSVAALWAVKASLLVIYFELSLHLSKKMKIALWTAAAYCALTFVVTIFLHVFLCHPTSRNWTMLDNFCSAYISPPFFITFLVFSLTTDITLMLIPSIIIQSLHLQRRERYAFLFVVAVGSVSIIASIMRFTVVYTTSDGLEVDKSSGDLIAIWGMIELTAAFIACCMPSFRIFLRRNDTPKSSNGGSYGSRYGSRYGLNNKTNLGNIPLNSYVEPPSSNSETELYTTYPPSDASRVHAKTSISSSV